MIDINNAVQINVKPRLAKLISWLLSTTTLLILFMLIWVIFSSTEKIGDDWLLALVAIFPPLVVGTAAWQYIVLAKKSFSSNDLLEETSRILSIEIPQLIAKRIIYYTHIKTEDSYYHEVIGPETILRKTSDLKNTSLLESEELAKKVKECGFSIETNNTTGVHSCQYRIKGEGGIENDYPLLKGFEIGIQLNVSQIEVTFDFNEVNFKDIFERTKKTIDGAKVVGYEVRAYFNNVNLEDISEQTKKTIGGNEVVGCEVRTYPSADDIAGSTLGSDGPGPFKIKARLKNKTGESYLVDSNQKLFVLQDISVMIGYLISSLKNKD
jgi:hypothetical protein